MGPIPMPGAEAWRTGATQPDRRAPNRAFVWRVHARHPVQLEPHRPPACRAWEPILLPATSDSGPGRDSGVQAAPGKADVLNEIVELDHVASGVIDHRATRRDVAG